MPFIDGSYGVNRERLDRMASKWNTTADSLGNIPLYDFYMQAAGDIHEQRDRLSGTQMQIVLLTAVLYVSIYNCISAIRMIMARPYTIAAWCCLFPSLIGCLAPIFFANAVLGGSATCRDIMLVILIGMVLVNPCNSLVLLQKIYLILSRPKWIIYVGILLITIQLSYITALFYSTFTFETKVGCVDYYPKIFVWCWLSVSMPGNILFSVLFSRIALKQYRIFGSDMWKRLARDGLQIMFMTVLCNMICSSVIAFRIGGNNAELCFIIDWVVITTLLAKHCEIMCKTSGESNRPKTKYMRGVSQIITMTPIAENDDLRHEI
ncbi:hypothetical protein BDF19DRAFT_449319 [Syncephalis fuscata]|nr:hypothetical protein BDF19DRAFT_449319 [Syncephalis fuscata]